jgi:hypothetical protein
MSVPLEYATPGTPRQTMPMGPTWRLMGVAGVLTVFSLPVIYRSMNDEPYYGGVVRSDAIVQVGVASVLVAFWAQWCVLAVWLRWRKRVHWAVLALLLWGMVCVYFLCFCVDGYLSDVITAQQWTPPTGAPATRTVAPTTRGA